MIYSHAWHDTFPSACVYVAKELMLVEKYKPIRSDSTKPIQPEQKIEHLHNEIASVPKDAKTFENPVVIGSLLYKLVQERENSNRLLKTILQTLEARLEQFEKRIQRLEQAASKPHATPSPSQTSQPLLSQVDSDIVAFVLSKGKVCAEDVRAHFKYRGKNAASSRLNRLFELGVLEKRQAGRKVYYRVM